MKEHWALAAPQISPYARFNVFRNPFGELTREERAELAIVDPGPWLAAIAAPRTALQFIGPAGAGKTTHLLALQRRLPGAPYVYLPEEGPLPAIPPQRPLLLDEAQRLPRRRRRILFRQPGPLLLGTHRDLTEELEDAGWRAVTIWVTHLHSADQLTRLLNRRIEACRLTPAPVPRIGTTHAMALLQRHGASIRAIEHDLYEQFQNAVRRGLPWPPAS